MTSSRSRGVLILLLVASAAQLTYLIASAAASGGHRDRTPAPPAVPSRSVAPLRRAAHAKSGKGASPKAPSGPPLVSGEGAYAEGSEPESEAQGPPAGSEPLVDNGLGSPLCDGRSVLSATAKRNCETSGFVAASAPGIDYEIDVHIDKGAFDLTALAEGLFLAWLVKRPWNALVWAVHAVLVAIEWSFTIDLLSSPAMSAVASALKDAQRAFTEPWVAGALAVGAVLLAWRGIVRGRVAQSLGEAVALLAMMACGLWMIADPIGTVGAVARWADLAGVQTLGAVSSGSASRAPSTLADSMGQLFGATVNGPWCYLEFGNVGWCEDPGRLDLRLRASALRIASEKAGEAGSASPSALGRRGAAARSAELLRVADTNGQLFLALPANDPERNSIKEEGSLLYALCQSSDATRCHGPTAAEAEFRTPRGTSDRFVGILLIAAGIVGMLLLFGFVVMRMLGASILALLLLLAAPVVVLAPAFGDAGRALFKQWAGRLFAAAGSKLIWSFLLGVLLVAMRVVLLLHGLGWWVQWLLLCILWWGSFLQRHRILVPAHRPHADGAGGIRGVGARLKRAYKAGPWAWGRVWDHAERAQRRREQERKAPKLPPSESPRPGPGKDHGRPGPGKDHGRPGPGKDHGRPGPGKDDKRGGDGRDPARPRRPGPGGGGSDSASGDERDAEAQAGMSEDGPCRDRDDGQGHAKASDAEGDAEAGRPRPPLAPHERDEVRSGEEASEQRLTQIVERLMGGSEESAAPASKGGTQSRSGLDRQPRERREREPSEREASEVERRRRQFGWRDGERS